MDQSILIAIASLLFTGNLFFIKKLVDKVEAGNVSSIRTADLMETFGAQIKELKQDIKELRRIELDVAVLKHTIRGENEKSNQ